MSRMAGRFIQITLAGAALVLALALIQVRAVGRTNLVAAVENDRAARTLTIRLQQAEMLMQTGCMEAGTY